MKTPVVLFTFLLSCSMPLASGQSMTNVGVIDTNRVMQESKSGSAMIRSLEESMTKQMAKLETAKTKMHNKQTLLLQGEPLVSPEKKRELENEIHQDMTEFNRQYTEAERNLDLQRENYLAQFRKEIAPLIQQVADEKGLDVIFNQAISNNPMVYFNERVDITDEVIELYNAR